MKVYQYVLYALTLTLSPGLYDRGFHVTYGEKSTLRDRQESWGMEGLTVGLSPLLSFSGLEWTEVYEYSDMWIFKLYINKFSLSRQVS